MPAQTPRERFLQARQHRQTLTFAVVLSTMAALVVLSLLVLTGILPVPFGAEFSKQIKYAEAGDIPCPTEKAGPVDPASIKVQILNTTSRPGLASEATNMLTQLGYTPLEAGNSGPEYAGVVEIEAGPAGVDAAYTVARFFKDSKVVLTESTDATVTVLLGTFYDGPMAADEAQRIANSTDRLTAPTKCIAMSEEMLAGITMSAQSGESAQSDQSGAPAQSGPVNQSGQ